MRGEGGDVIGQVHPHRLAQLGRDVADEHPERGRRRDRLADLRQQEARQEARVDAAWPEDDQLRVGDRGQRVLACSGISRRDPGAVDPPRSRDDRLAVDDRPVVEPGMHRERRGGGRQDLAADRQDAVRQPDRLLEVAVLELGHGGEEDVPDRVPAEGPAARRRRVGGRSRETMLQDLADERLVVGERGEAAADVADRRDRHRVAEDAGRAAVVGDGDDRGQVARALLEAAQQHRQAVPSADRDDPRPASQRLSLVDELDQAAARRRHERRGQGADRAVRTEAHQGQSGDPGHEPAEPVRQELEGDRVEGDADEPAGLGVLRGLADHVGDAERQDERAGEGHQQPALDPDPGGEPAAEVHRPTITPGPARDGTRRRDRNPVRGASPPAPRRARSSGGSRRCSRARSLGGSSLH